MLTVNIDNAKSWSEIGERGAFGKSIIDVANEMPDVVVVTADLADATKVTRILQIISRAIFSDRHC